MRIHSIINLEFMEEGPIFLNKAEFILLNSNATIKANIFLDECA